MLFILYLYWKGKKKTGAFDFAVISPAVPKNNFMLTYKSLIFKSSPSQDSYDLEISSIKNKLSSCKCPVCNSSSFVNYGSYKRRIFVPNSKPNHHLIILKVHRILCTCCNITHALLPDCLLVRSPFTIFDASSIFDSSQNEIELFLIENEDISNYVVNHLTNKLSHWFKNHIHIDFLSSSISHLIDKFICFHLYQHKTDRYYRLLV